MREREAWDGDDLPDPWEGDHDIEYWVWRGDRLTPATPDELAHIQEDERTREALFRLERLHEHERREARGLAHSLVALCVRGASRVRVAVQWLRIWRRKGASTYAENARAERSSTR